MPAVPRPYYKINRKDIESMLRVDHAGEYGAQRIYQGQLRFTADSIEKKEIQYMLSEELKHLRYFESSIKDCASSPTILMPIWHIGGYLVGAISSIMGNKTAMLVTDKVEEVIVNHYDDQIKSLERDVNYSNLKDKLVEFREDELSHQHIATEYGSRKAFAEPVISFLISSMCKIAIYLSKRL